MNRFLARRLLCDKLDRDETPRRALADSLRELGLDVQPQAHLGAEILATRPFSARRAA